MTRTAIPYRRAAYELLDSGMEFEVAKAALESLNTVNNGEYVYLDDVNAAVRAHGLKTWAGE